MSEFSGPVAPCPNDDAHGDIGCAQVIAEVWTLLDGECTPENKETAASAPRGLPRMLQALRARGADQGVGCRQVLR